MSTLTQLSILMLVTGVILGLAVGSLALYCRWIDRHPTHSEMPRKPRVPKGGSQ